MVIAACLQLAVTSVILSMPDVQEPANADDPIYKHKNTVALPHSGVGTHEVFEDLAKLIVENLQRYRDGRELLHRLV